MERFLERQRSRKSGDFDFFSFLLFVIFNYFVLIKRSFCEFGFFLLFSFIFLSGFERSHEYTTSSVLNLIGSDSKWTKLEIVALARFPTYLCVKL